MRLLIIRHAIAEDRETFAHTGQDDSLRPLTAEGRRKMLRAAGSLVSLVPSLDAILTSPFVRAADTAAIVAGAYGGMATQTVDALVPDASPNALPPVLRSAVGDSVVAVVGHEPHLSSLAAWLLTGKAGEFITLKKGGVCLIEFDGAARAGAGSLLWLLTPSQLRGLA